MANLTPTLTVEANGNAVSNDETLIVREGSSVADLAITITAADAESDPVTVTAAIAGMTTEGLVRSEFEQPAAAAPPVVLMPTTGSFPVPNATLTITLTVSDGNSQAVFRFAINVQPDQPPVITVTADGSDVLDDGTIVVDFNKPLAEVGLAIRVDDADGDTTRLTAILNGVTTEGLLVAEFEQTPAAAVPFVITPASGKFGVEEATIRVDLIADDGVRQTAFTFHFRVEPRPRRECAAIPGGGNLLWLWALLATLLLVRWRLRQR